MTLFLLAFFFAFSCFPAHAAVKVAPEHSFPKTNFDEQQPGSSKEPVLFSADRVDYDHEKNIVTATGHVQIAQGDSILLADAATYDMTNDIVKAHGNVSMLEPSGNVYFADEMELHNDMKSGVIDNLKGRLKDNSVLVAAKGNRIDEQHFDLYKAVYTPCKCGTADQPVTPTWALSAAHATIDEQAQRMYYGDAYFDLYGVPVVYTPYFSNPTPGASNQSGLLMPTLMDSSELGLVYKQPVYYTIAPDKDITLTPIYTSRNGPVMAGEYRQKFDEGPLDIQGSITSAPNTDALGNPIAGQETRGNINAKGLFTVDENNDWGFNIQRATDDTYLHLYGFSDDTLLTSTVYAETFNFADSDRTYASIKGLSFQGLTGLDDPHLVPVVLPLIDGTWQSDPGIYHSRFSLDGDTMALFRQEGDESRRLSGSAGWNLPYITDDGEVITFNSQLRTDLYDVGDYVQGNGQSFSGVTGREIPEADVTWRYPFINNFGGLSTLMLEPVVETSIISGGGDATKIPNEDSLLTEFNDSNLFSADRYPGLDRVENGSGASYGLRGQAQLYSDKYLDWLVGQHYRIANDTEFPFSRDPNSRFSDYVGRIDMSSQPWTLAYRFRLDHDTLAATRNEIDSNYNMYPLSLSASYLSLRDDPILESKEIISLTGALSLTKEWSWNVTGSRDMLLGELDTLYTGFTFKNECINLTTLVGKDYTNLLDIKPSMTFMVQVSLKNLE